MDPRVHIDLVHEITLPYKEGKLKDLSILGSSSSRRVHRLSEYIFTDSIRRVCSVALASELIASETSYSRTRLRSPFTYDGIRIVRTLVSRRLRS